MTTLIGRRCKEGNLFSRPVLISRATWPFNSDKHVISRLILFELSRVLHLASKVGDAIAWDLEGGRASVPDPEPGAQIRFGGNGGGDTPVPISNTEVKPSCADGTALVMKWESRSLPGFFFACFFCLSLFSYRNNRLIRHP